MIKKKKIKFELLIVSENNKRKSDQKPLDFWTNLISATAREVSGRFFAIVAIICVFALIVYSDKLIKQTLEWLIDILKDI